jgi:hypothetical protein
MGRNEGDYQPVAARGPDPLDGSGGEPEGLGGGRLWIGSYWEWIGRHDPALPCPPHTPNPKNKQCETE